MNSQAIGATESTLQSAVGDLDILQMLKRLLMELRSNSIVDQQGRQRVTVDAMSAGINLGGVGTITAVTTMLGWDQRQIAMQSRIQFADCIRSKIS